MITSELVPAETATALTAVAADLAGQFHDLLSQAAVEDLVLDSYLKRGEATGIAGIEQLARERLAALARSADRGAKVPAVLFLCTHNAGRSQMALGWFSRLAGQGAIAWSGGSEPASEINPGAVEAMAEVGIDISGGLPKPWTDEVLEAVDIVVTMGCGDSCPLIPGKQYEDWPVADPAGAPRSEIRSIRDDVGRRVRDLLERLGIPVIDRGVGA